MRSGIAVVHTTARDTDAAAAHLVRGITTKLDGERPDAVVLFASPNYDFDRLLKQVDGLQAPVVVGCSSAGEFTEGLQATQSACAMALRSPDIQFAGGLGRGITASRRKAVQDIVASFVGRESWHYPYRSALVLTDALGGFADDLVEELTVATSGRYQIFGGGAGDDAKFERTHVFYQGHAYFDAAVALEILSQKPIGIGVKHGWQPASAPMRVTEAADMRLISLNARPAADVVADYAATRRQQFDRDKPLDFFLHNIFGIDTGLGYKLRVPLAVNADGSITCAAEIPVGTSVCLMETTNESAAQAAASATKAALEQLGRAKPAAAVFFDCVATRLRMGSDFGFELTSLRGALPETALVGCNTYGQIARVDRQFSGFHNCTAVVCVIPE